MPATRRSLFSLSFFLAAALATLGATAKDPVVDAPLPPEEAARTMVVPEGFRITLFAGEPDVRQPIAFAIDDRGRLWVAEAYAYPKHSAQPGRDRIVIFEDEDGDGRHDRRSVFYEELNYVSGIEVGFGGAWVVSPPYFYFIPDRDGDDRPDGEPRVVLDGFGNHANAHNMANGLAWGPDGWLYGTHGRTNWSSLGRPGTPESERVRFDGGVYRYHPVRDVWEAYADGTTNPWGIDWNDWGQAFISNCVNPHLFHVIQGAHYEPWRNRRSSQHAYARIPTIADHLHFLGGANVRAEIGAAAELDAGGGHAHCGAMVYLADSWPERYRNTVFMNNVHGRRINNDVPKRAGSGYTATHARDLMISRDPWYMGVTLRYGPDGSVFASDWSDTGECHSTRNTRRHTGRIYKISYGEPAAKSPGPNLASLADEELVELQLHRNDWFVRHARRLLQERSHAARDMSAVHRRLHTMFREQSEVPRKLRALWALHVTGGVDDSFLVERLDDDSESIRAWAVQLLCEDRDPPPEALQRFRELAASGASQLVRLHLASVLQRLRAADRWPIGEALASRAEDADDPNLPLMLWYGVEPLVDSDIDRFVALAGAATIPLLRRHIARRVASLETRSAREGLEALARLLEKTDDDGARSDLLAGMLRGLEGRRRVRRPRSWPLAYARLQESPRASLRRDAERLALIFDDPAALRSLRERAADADVPADERRQAVDTLVARKADDLPPLLLKLINDPATRRAALRGLAEYDHPETAATILRSYASLDPAAKRDAVQALASRPAWAMQLLDAVESGQIPAGDLSAYTARQLRNLGDPRVIERVRAVWGELRATPEDRAQQIADYRSRLTRESLSKADLSEGREIFEKTCGSCHRLFDAGGTIGPDLTGAQRANLDYILENLIDPSAAVSKDYQMEVITTVDGRVITGLIETETSTSVTVQTVNERIVVPSPEILSRSRSSLSIMPDGLLTPLTFAELRDLIAYLASPKQVPAVPGAPKGRAAE